MAGKPQIIISETNVPRLQDQRHKRQDMILTKRFDSTASAKIRAAASARGLSVTRRRSPAQPGPPALALRHQGRGRSAQVLRRPAPWQARPPRSTAPQHATIAAGSFPQDRGRHRLASDGEHRVRRSPPSRRPEKPTHSSAATSANRSRHSAKGRIDSVVSNVRYASVAPDRNAADSRVSTGPDAIQPGRGGSMGRTMVVWTRDFLMAVAYFIAALMAIKEQLAPRLV